MSKVKIKGKRVEVYKEIIKFLKEEVKTLHPGSWDCLGHLNTATDHLDSAIAFLEAEKIYDDVEVEYP